MGKFLKQRRNQANMKKHCRLAQENYIRINNEIDSMYAWSLKEFNLQVTPRREPRMWGSKLIKHYVVGTCTKSCNGIYIKNRGEVNYLSERDIPSNIGKQSKGSHNKTYSSYIYWYFYYCFHVH